MIKDTLQKINHIVSSSDKLSQQQKQELTELTQQLEAELAKLSNDDQAQSIANFTKATAHESQRQHTDPELLDISAEGLKTSARQFEASHPGLTRVIQAICNAFGV